MLSNFDTKLFPDQRWYMFQGMGPSPSGRSGHAMASFQSKVFVLGGESFAPSKTDDFTHVLDTSESSAFDHRGCGSMTFFLSTRTYQISGRQQRTACFSSSSRKPKHLAKTHSNTSKYSGTAARSNTERERTGDVSQCSTRAGACDISSGKKANATQRCSATGVFERCCVEWER